MNATGTGPPGSGRKRGDRCLAEIASKLPQTRPNNHSPLAARQAFCGRRREVAQLFARDVESSVILWQIGVLQRGLNAARETVFRFQAEISRLEDELERRAA